MANHPSDLSLKALRKTLKEVRLAAGMNQLALAELLNKPQSYISKYESGERKLDYLEVRNICYYCNISIETFEQKLIKNLPHKSNI